MHDIWNPWHGCKKCSPGCKNCYMYYLDFKRGVEKSSEDVVRTNNFNYPLSKDRHKQYKVKSGERIRVNMTSDTFIDEADSWRDEMWDIVRQRPDVIFWFLTKRPERMIDHLPADWGDGYDNCFMNITCENQEMFDKRYQYLIDLPAKHKGLCLAPLISDIDISPALETGVIKEVAVGGENYNNPRPCDYAWVEHIAKTCAKYRVNFCWYETGTNLVKDDIKYHMPNKQTQGIQAYFAGLNQHYYDIKFDLKLPDGTLLDETSLYKKQYNLNHCMFCSNQKMCNGCSQCGNCGGHEILVSAQEFIQAQYCVLAKDKPVSGGYYNVYAR